MNSLLILSVITWYFSAAYGLTAADFKGKNIVLFITDQERSTVNFPAGWEEANMPGLQRLKANGMTFKRAYTNSVTCSSARASLLTGLMPPQHRVRYKLRYDMPADKYPQVELPTDIANLGSVARAAGYTTIYKGKIDAFKGPNSTIAQPDAMHAYSFDRWNPPDSGLGNGIPEFGGGTAPGANNDARYMYSRASNQSDVDAGLEGALQYVTEVAPSQQPFFLVVSLINPHDVVFYPTNLFTQAGYNDTVLKGDIALPPTAGESLLPTKPYAQWDFNNITNQVLGPLNTTDKQVNYVNFYGNLIKTSDNYLVQLLDALQPLINNTVVIKTSDHGEGGLSHGLIRQKCYNYYEETAHVPLVYSNPILFPTAQTSDALVSHIDLLPTLADLFGQPNIAPFTGISYAPVIVGRNSSVQDYVVFSMEDYQIGQSSPPYVKEPNHLMCIRESQWKFCKYYDPAAEVTKVGSVFEMYNLEADPSETTNLASPYHTRTADEEAQYKRLNQKLKQVQKTRLAPRRVQNTIQLTLNITSSSKDSSSNEMRYTGTVAGMPVGSGNVTLSSNSTAITKMTISSGSGIIRGQASNNKSTIKFTSGTGTYQKITGDGLKWTKNGAIINIDGVATY